jgi:exosortase
MIWRSIMDVRWRHVLAPLVLGGLIVWAYWPNIVEMTDRWFDDPQYSHGFVVPIFATYLLWFRRKHLDISRSRPNWCGLILLVAAMALWTAGTYTYMTFLADMSLLVCLAALAVTLGGVVALRWSWQSILFLALMVPLPYRLQSALGGDLQRFASTLSTYVLQTLGVPAIQEGNVILIKDLRIGVSEACGGLGMLATFLALSTGVALLLTRSDLWLRLAVIVSALPVAILTNVLRIAVTGVLLSAAQEHLARVVFHDIAGWLMMPLAVAILFGEMLILNRLVVNSTERRERARPRIRFPGVVQLQRSPATGSRTLGN